MAPDRIRELRAVRAPEVPAARRRAPDQGHLGRLFLPVLPRALGAAQ